MPKISIITPVYIDIDDKVYWLDEMIQSVINQTITDWELILIGDNSPIVYDDIVTKYDNDKRLRWAKNATNEGPARTRNTAVALAESDCILPLDSDDMLATDEVLERMYEVWQRDKTKIIYGNLQQLIKDINGFKRGKVFSLGNYTFELAMNLEGVMPVTAMHSKECHYQAGGWKHELNQGLEDLEYWISAGERGFCGQKIQYTTLLYRRQENSRAYRMKHIDQNFREMQNKIKEMHAPIYRGEFPVACCGKGKANAPSAPNLDPIVMSAQNQGIRKITELSGYDENDKEWVTYQGQKKGSFSILVRGPSSLPSSYMVLGTGHAFQIHKRHKDFFSQRQHMGFRINQPDPREQEKEEPKPVEIKQPQVIAQPKPELSTLIRLDSIGSQTRKAIIQAPTPKDSNEVIIEPNPPTSYSNVINNQSDVSSLKLTPKITKMLDSDHWTVERLAGAAIADLTTYDGVGVKRAQSIIDKAQELINKQ